MPTQLAHLPSPHLPLPDTLARLRSFAHGAKRARQPRCELCTAPLDAEHEHVVECANGQLHCCCGACALLFRNPEALRYRTVPRDVIRLDDFCMSDSDWENLAIPIDLAFLLTSTRTGGVVAVYPSPAGGTESQPSAEAWRRLVDQNPVLATLASDVEALLVHRVEGARECFRAPIDECYKLVGLVRSSWRGFSGGLEMWQRVGQFFEQLRARSIQ